MILDKDIVLIIYIVLLVSIFITIGFVSYILYVNTKHFTEQDIDEMVERSKKLYDEQRNKGSNTES